MKSSSFGFLWIVLMLVIAATGLSIFSSLGRFYDITLRDYPELSFSGEGQFSESKARINGLVWEPKSPSFRQPMSLRLNGAEVELTGGISNLVANGFVEDMAYYRKYQKLFHGGSIRTGKIRPNSDPEWFSVHIDSDIVSTNVVELTFEGKGTVQLPTDIKSLRQVFGETLTIEKTLKLQYRTVENASY